jgi:hypothetical protein
MRRPIHASGARLVRSGALAALALAACAHGELQPASQVQSVHGDPGAARARVHGVTLVADPAAAPDVAGRVGVQVTVFNGSDVPIRVGPSVFRLVTADGTPYAALSSSEVGRLAQETPDLGNSPYVGVYGDDVAGLGYDFVPAYGPWYSGFGAFPGAATWSPWYYPYYQAGPGLPAREKGPGALADQELDPGASVTGVIQFQKLPQGTQQVRLHQTLVEAKSGAAFGDAEIPFARR